MVGEGGHPHQLQLALEALAGQLCDVSRPSRGASGSEVTTQGQDPKFEKGVWSRPA